MFFGNEVRTVKLGEREVGSGQPVYIIAEIGINHNGSMDVAKKLIEGAKRAGCDAVKFQKRTPEICVPKDQWYIERSTPWGPMTYIDYRHKVEFSREEYREIDRYCRELGIQWFVSPWDVPSVDFTEEFNPPVYKVASASLTDIELLERLRKTGRPIMLSSGMSTLQEVDTAVKFLGDSPLLLAQSTSAYPCKTNELNLRVINTYRARYPRLPIGYSGHETGLAPTYAAVALGACFVERHVTLDRSMWGTDQAASLEIVGLERLVRDIRDIELALGDGEKRVYSSELGPRQKLRRVQSVNRGFEHGESAVGAVH
jgi:N-acetylneuraminate synthase